MKRHKTLCLLSLMLLLLLPSCAEKIPEETVSSTTESYVFSEEYLVLSLGSLDWPEDHEAQEEAYLPVRIAEEFRLCGSFEEYKAYQELIIRLFPDANQASFPDIPAEWFESHSLVTLFRCTAIDSGTEVMLLDRYATGDGLYFFLEGWTESGFVPVSPEGKRALVNLMIPMEKAETIGLRTIGYIPYGPIDADSDSERAWYEGKRQDDIAARKTALDNRIAISEVEGSYHRAINDLPDGQIESAVLTGAVLTYTPESGLVSDGRYDDTEFHIKFRLYPAGGLFPAEALTIESYADYYAYLYGPYREWMQEYDLPGWYYDWGILVSTGEMEDYYASSEAFTDYGSVMVTVPKLREILADDRVALVYLSQAYD